MYAQAQEDTLNSFKKFSQSYSSEQYLFNEPAMKFIMAEIKNSESNKQKPQLSSYQSKNQSSSQSLQGDHITKAIKITTTTQEISSTKQAKEVTKKS